jgi:hypothetical protein
MGNFHDANYNITKIRTSNGDIAELELNGKSVALASDEKIEENKEVTITENGTIEITPSEGKDGMKKVTATVNVPSSGGITALYAWTDTDDNNYGTVTPIPSVGDKAYGLGQRIGSTISSEIITDVTETTIALGSTVCTRTPDFDVNPLWE